MKQLATALVVVCGLLAGGCSEKNRSEGDKSGPKAAAPAAGAAQTPSAPAEVKPALTPAQAWVKSVMDCYEKAMTDTVAALEGDPAAEQALPKLQAIKGKAVEALVPLGRQREEMNAATRAQAEMAMWQSLEAFQKNETFQKYLKSANGPYALGKAQSDPQKETAALVSGMNIITQYAHFEVLKKQAPKEAERLGIK
ncbi:MAG: hypothetical protein NTV86_11145 [Planctomycetota bacterium]|nr:hypothetical protein [Planctomycetota bacterium]